MHLTRGAGLLFHPGINPTIFSFCRPFSTTQVKLADDADEVLAKCRSLRDALRMKASSTGGNNDDVSDDEWGIDEEEADAKKEAARKVDGSKTQQIRLSDLKSGTTADGKAIVEVVEMNTTQVMEGIENVAVKIAKQVLAKQVRWLLSDVHL